MARTSSKNPWILVLLILAGVVLGSFIAHYAAQVSFLSWLNYGSTFGLDTAKLDIGVMILTFGVKIRFTIASLLGIAIAIFVYRKI